MSKVWAFIRKYFLRKDDGQKNSTQDKEETTEKREPNEFQKVVKAPRPYDEVVLEEDGSGPKVDGTNSSPNNYQDPPKRAERSYEEVDIPNPESGQKIVMKE